MGGIRSQNRNKGETAIVKADQVKMVPIDISKSNSITEREGYKASITQDNGTYFLKPYNELELEMYVRENFLAIQCVDLRIKATTGQGYNDETPEEIAKVFKPKTYERLNYDYEIGGMCFEEVHIKDGRPIKSYHMPSSSMFVTSDRKHVIQNPELEHPKTWPLFDEDEYNAGRQNNGVYVIMRTKYLGNDIYGIPAWIGAKDLLKIAENEEINISNFYDEDAIAKTIMMLFGITDPEGNFAKEVKSFLEKNFQGVAKKNRMWLMSGLPAKDFGRAIEFKELNKDIVNASSLALMDKIETRTTIAFGVPQEVLGYQTTGSLGNSNHVKAMIYFFNTYSIYPVQKVFTDPIKVFYPNVKNIGYKQFEIPDNIYSDSTAVETQKAEAQAIGFLNKLLSLMAEKEEN